MAILNFFIATFQIGVSQQRSVGFFVFVFSVLVLFLAVVIVLYVFLFGALLFCLFFCFCFYFFVLFCCVAFLKRKKKAFSAASKWIYWNRTPNLKFPINSPKKETVTSSGFVKDQLNLDKFTGKNLYRSSCFSKFNPCNWSIKELQDGYFLANFEKNLSVGIL